MVSNNMCVLIMIINVLWGICRVVRWKYDISRTSHIYNIHQTMSSTTGGKKIHKEKKRGKKTRRVEDLQVLKVIVHRDYIEENTMVGE